MQRQQPRGQKEEDERRLQDGEPAERPEKRAGSEQRDGEQRNPPLRLRADDQIRSDQIQAKENEGKQAIGGEADSGEMEDAGQERGPDGKRDGGIEVAVEIPVAGEVVADGGVAVPAL